MCKTSDINKSKKTEQGKFAIENISDQMTKLAIGKWLMKPVSFKERKSSLQKIFQRNIDRETGNFDREKNRKVVRIGTGSTESEISMA